MPERVTVYVRGRVVTDAVSSTGCMRFFPSRRWDSTCKDNTFTVEAAVVVVVLSLVPWAGEGRSV